MRKSENESSNSAEYVASVNRAIDFVLENLDAPLKLETVAEVAHFSPFHFHRVFQSIVGETLNDFVKRVRLERALRMLSHSSDKSLTEIAFACGFGSSSDFSRSFKQRFGVPPSKFDIASFREQRRDEWQLAVETPETRHLLDRLPVGQNPDGFEVEMRELPARQVAYIRVLDPYRPQVVVDAAERLVAWASKRGLEGGTWLGYMWDDPEIVSHKDCRYDVGVEVSDVRPEGEVGVFNFPPMLVAELQLRGPIELEQRALDWIFTTWISSSGYLPSDQPCFEVWHGLPFAHGYEHFEISLHLPVERARK